MKKIENVLREYARKLSDEDLRYLTVRFSQSLSGDRADLADFFAKERSVDNWLSSAVTCTEWFDMIDTVGDSIKKENTRRYGEDSRRSKKSKSTV